jgi:hypothetical protein
VTRLVIQVYGKGDNVVIEGFVGLEVSRAYRERLERRARHNELVLEAARVTHQPTLRARTGDILIRTGCRIAGMDIPTCLKTFGREGEPRIGSA